MSLSDIKRVLAVYRGIAAKDKPLATPYLHPTRYRQHNPDASDGVGMCQRKGRLPLHLLSISIALLAAAAIIVIGLMYLFVPRTMMKSFGLPLPGDNPNVPWWLRLKGSRDIVSGLIVLALVAWGEPRLIGIVLAIAALIPIGDMSLVLAAKGSVRTALSVHGLTAAVMLLGAVPLITGLA